MVTEANLDVVYKSGGMVTCTSGNLKGAWYYNTAPAASTGSGNEIIVTPEEPSPEPEPPAETAPPEETPAEPVEPEPTAPGDDPDIVIIG